MTSRPPSGNVIDLKNRPSTLPLPELFGEIRALALRRLPAILAEVLDQADDALFDFVQRSASSVEQQDYFDAMRELRRQRAAVELRFREHFLDAFTALERRRLVSSPFAESAASTLSLVEPDELEEQLTCEQLAATLERRHADAHRQLEQRMALLVGLSLDSTKPPEGPQAVTVGANPVSAQQLCAAFRFALAAAQTNIQARLVLYKVFEREALESHGQLLHDINTRLHEAGIVAEAAPVAPVARPARERVEQPARLSIDPAREAAPQRAHGVSTGSIGSMAEPVDDLFVKVQEVFSAYVAARRQVSHRNGPPRPTFGGRGALNALSAMQHAIPARVMRAADDPQISLCTLLREELLSQGQRMGLTPGNAELLEQDEQPVFLVGMLFDVLLGQRSYERGVREQFVRLSVPYAKAAMIDQGLFAHKTHPARQLLNELSEACDGNHGESASERELLSRVTGIADRLVAEFNEDVAIFTELEQEFRAYIEQYRRRIELAERRATEAQRGRERLEEARISAAMEVALLMGAREAPQALDAFLSRYWTHHIAVVSLRDGTDSARYAEAKAAGELLWRTFLACENGDEPPAELHDQLLPVLASSGVTGEAAGDVLEAIDWVLQALRLGRREAARTHQLPAFEGPAAITSMLPVEPVAGAAPVAVDGTVAAGVAVDPTSTNAASPTLEVVGGTDTLDFDPADVERIRAMELGAWVEFVDADGSAQPAKLSWISPISSRLLFVNRRGMRLCANSAEELAAMMKQGKLVLREVDSAFERAMTQVLGKLRETMPGQ